MSQSGETTRVRRAPRTLYRLWSWWQPEQFGPWDNTDEALADTQDALVARMRIAHRHSRPDVVEALYAEWCCIEDEIRLRADLRERYGARPDGTDVMAEHADGAAPSYWLAMLLDYREHHRSEPSVLTWKAAA